MGTEFRRPRRYACGFLLATLGVCVGLSVPGFSNRLGNQSALAASESGLEGWRLELRVDRRNYDNGDRVLLHATLKNDRESGAEVRNNGAERDYRILLTGPGGANVPATDFGREIESDYDLVGPIQTIPASGLESEIDVAARYDLSARGEYCVKLQRRVLSFGLRTARLIESNEVCFSMRSSGAFATRAVSPRPKASEVPWGTVVEGVQISVTTSKGTVRPSDPIVLVLAMRNASNQLMKYVASSPSSDYRFRVVDGMGNSAQPTEFYRDFLPNGSRFGLEFFPGEQTKDSIDLRDLYKLDRPGTYTVTVTRRVPTSDGTGWVEAAAKPLPISVRGST